VRTLNGQGARGSEAITRTASTASAGYTIWLDANAAGWGWFLDPTPSIDSAFTTPGNQDEQNRKDLLTVLEHEIGYRMGDNALNGGLMDSTLLPGSPETPTEVLDQLFGPGSKAGG
jgi:hypothetical protein